MYSKNVAGICLVERNIVMMIKKQNQKDHPIAKEFKYPHNPSPKQYRMFFKLVSLQKQYELLKNKFETGRNNS